MKRVYSNENACIGCRLCEIYCAAAHTESKDLIKAFKHERDDLIGRIVVEEAGPLTFGLQCRHCDEPSCVQACMTGAMSKDLATGIVEHDADKCVGCWMCMLACPYGAIKRHGAKHLAVKCDLCKGRDVPACVENCPNRALIYEER